MILVNTQVDACLPALVVLGSVKAISTLIFGVCPSLTISNSKLYKYHTLDIIHLWKNLSFLQFCSWNFAFILLQIEANIFSKIFVCLQRTHVTCRPGIITGNGPACHSDSSGPSWTVGFPANIVRLCPLSSQQWESSVLHSMTSTVLIIEPLSFQGPPRFSLFLPD